MKRFGNERRALRALGNLCNDTLSASEGRWLANQLRTNLAMRDLYVDYMTMHANISSEVAAFAPAELEAAVHASIDAPAITPSAVPTTSHPPKGRLLGRSWLALAATLMFVMLLGGVLGGLLTAPKQQVAESNDSTTLPAIAQITSTQDCRWGDLSGDIGYGSKLHAGQTLQLSEGLAEITFEDGATMLLESPATVIFEAAHQIEIREGRLAAIVPPESRRLSIHTKTLDLRNVDAEFGLLAKETGISELHVFNGTIEANFLDAQGHRREQMEIRASEAVMASPSMTTILEFPANETHFVRSMSPVQEPHDGLLAYEGFAYPVGPLSLQNGGFGWAGPWATIAADASAGHGSNSVRGRSLTFEGIVPRGNHAAIVAQRNRIRRSLASSIGGVFDVAGLVENQNGVRLVGNDGTTVYLSFLQRVDRVDNGFYGLELHRGDGNDNRVLCIGNGADETSYGVTSAVNVYGVRNFPSLGKENTEANFFVVKISFGGGNRDVVEVFRNPESLKDEKLCKADVVLKGNFAFDRISLANFDGAKIHEIDELRVGTHFLAVTGRWGAERGRLLRRLTDADSLHKHSPSRHETITSTELTFASIYRKLPLLGAFK